MTATLIPMSLRQRGTRNDEYSASRHSGCCPDFRGRPVDTRWYPRELQRLVTIAALSVTVVVSIIVLIPLMNTATLLRILAGGQHP